MNLSGFIDPRDCRTKCVLQHTRNVDELEVLRFRIVRIERIKGTLVRSLAINSFIKVKIFHVRSRVENLWCTKIFICSCSDNGEAFNFLEYSFQGSKFFTLLRCLSFFLYGTLEDVLFWFCDRMETSLVLDVQFIVIFLH